MKKILLVGALLAALVMSGCVTDTPAAVDIVTTKYQVVVPPDSILRCDYVKLPDTFKDNKAAASEIAKLYKRDSFCANNMAAVKAFIQKAQSDFQ